MLPGQRKSGECLHDAYAQVPFPGVIWHRHIQRMAEYVLHLVTVQDAHPITPQV